MKEGITFLPPQTVEIINLLSNPFPYQLGMTLLLETKFSFVYESIPRLFYFVNMFISFLEQNLFFHLL